MPQKIHEPEALHKDILNAAKELFSHFGFKKTAVDDIAKKARVAKGTIYNYFRNKEDLFQEVLREDGANVISLMREAVKHQETPEKKFQQMIIAKVKSYKEFCLLHEINRQRVEELLPFVKKERDEIDIKEIDIIEEILEEGVKNLVLQVKNIPTTAKALMIVIHGLEIGWTLEMDLEAAAAEIDDILRILFHGLKSRSEKE